MSKKKKVRKKSTSQRKALKKHLGGAKSSILTFKERKNLILLTQKLKKNVLFFDFGKRGTLDYGKKVLGTLRADILAHVPKQNLSEKERFALFQSGIRTFYNMTKGKWDRIDIRIIDSVRIRAV